MVRSEAATSSSATCFTKKCTSTDVYQEPGPSTTKSAFRIDSSVASGTFGDEGWMPSADTVPFAVATAT